MEPLNLVLLIAMGLVFVLWVVCMFRMLWHLTRQSADRLNETGGGYFTWMGHSLSSFGDYFSSDENRAERRRLYLLTALLFALIIAQPVLLATGR